MSSELWHGLSHQKAWSNVGDSYSQLSQECKLKAQTNPLLASSRISPNSVPAGLLSSAKPRGAGSFQLQSEWRLSENDAGHRTYCTEVAEKYKSPPSTAKPAESQAQKGKLSSFPKETYPSDFRTHKQIDFDAMRLVDCKKPGRAQRPADSESILGTYPADANLPGPAAAATPTQARLPLMDGTMRDTAGIVLPTYNIITGDRALHNDRAKYWNGPQMDFRRRR